MKAPYRPQLRTLRASLASATGEDAKSLAEKIAARADGRHENKGRPPVLDNATERLTVRLSPEAKAKAQARGGNAWVRALIEAAE